VNRNPGRDDTTSFLIRGSLASFLTRIVGVGLSYVAAVVLSRSLGAKGYGVYSIALAWALILVLPSRAGLDFTALRYAAIYVEQGDRARLRALVRFAGVSILILSALTGAAVYGLTVEGLTSARPELAPGMALVILPVALLGLVAALLRNARRIVASQLYEQILRPGLLTLAMATALVAGIGLSPASAMMLTGASALIAMILGSVHALRAIGGGRGAADYAAWREWIALSLPIFLTSVVQELLNQIDIIMLGYLDTPQAAGLYSAAWRLASLVTFGLVALATVNGPLIAAAHARGDSGELARTARTTARLGFGASLVLTAVLAIGGRVILQLFGPEFGHAYPALLILLAGGLMNAFTGAVAYLLTMTGRQMQGLGIFIVSLAVSLTLNILLIPRLSIVGAAIASSSATITWNVAMLVLVRRRMGIDASALAAPLRPGT
jgi:O-antigen/teichoic acid export membrane protein